MQPQHLADQELLRTVVDVALDVCS